MTSLQEILAVTASRIAPNKIERERVTLTAEAMRARVDQVARSRGLKARVRINGSVAKDTWLSGDADIDIFLQIPAELPRSALERDYLDVARDAAGQYTERFAEHPYVEAYADGIRVNIVPCYDVKKGDWRSAADRTPHHTQYMASKLDDNLRREARLTKKFAKGIGVYGAETKTSGFSGMLCEILALHYHTFENLVLESASWKNGELIDVEGYYDDHRDEIADLFPASLIVIDPVDKGRNVAAAVAKKRMWSFVAASRSLTVRPRLEFFFPPSIDPLAVSSATEILRTRENDLLVVQFGPVDAVVDILWSQLYKTEKSLRNLFRTHGFIVLRSASWSNEKNTSAILVELERECLRSVFRHLGPPVWRRHESDSFLNKHAAAADTVTGPRIEDERWVVDKRRKYASAAQLLTDKMESGGRTIGVAARLAASCAKGFQILLNEQVMELYTRDRGFAQFLTDFLRGRPFWLE